MTGEYLIDLKFYSLSGFSNGNAYFQRDPTGNFGYINTNGQVLIDSLNGAGTFQYGFGPINIDYKWGVIDVAGKVVVEPQYDESINIMERDGEVWIMQYDDELKDWKKIEKLKSI